MSADVLVTLGRAVMAEKVSELPFLFALSEGDPDWDAQWETTPPAPGLDATGVLDLIGYARPTIVDFLQPDPVGLIVGSVGQKYSVASGRTRFLRVRLSVPAGSFEGVTVREIALFANPTIEAGVPPGQTILEPADVSDPGDLFRLQWLRPQFLSAATSVARNFILRV